MENKLGSEEENHVSGQTPGALQERSEVGGEGLWGRGARHRVQKQ